MGIYDIDFFQKEKQHLFWPIQCIYFVMSQCKARLFDHKLEAKLCEDNVTVLRNDTQSNQKQEWSPLEELEGEFKVQSFYFCVSSMGCGPMNMIIPIRMQQIVSYGH